MLCKCCMYRENIFIPVSVLLFAVNMALTCLVLAVRRKKCLSFLFLQQHCVLSRDFPNTFPSRIEMHGHDMVNNQT